MGNTNLKTGRMTHLIWPNDARPTSSRIQVSANCGGSDRPSVGLSGVASSLLEYLLKWNCKYIHSLHNVHNSFFYHHLEFCILYSNEGTILSMCTGSQMFSTKSSESVFLTTP